MCLVKTVFTAAIKAPLSWWIIIWVTGGDTHADTAEGAHIHWCYQLEDEGVKCVRTDLLTHVAGLELLCTGMLMFSKETVTQHTEIETLPHTHLLKDQNKKKKEVEMDSTCIIQPHFISPCCTGQQLRPNAPWWLLIQSLIYNHLQIRSQTSVFHHMSTS